MRNRPAYNFQNLFSPLDLITVLYILLSGIYMCFGAFHLTCLSHHINVRLMQLCFIIVVALVSKKYPGAFILFIKNLYPLIFLGFFYTETSYMKNIVFPENLDKYVFNAEQSIWGCQPSIEFAKAMPQHWFNELMNICYFSYYAITALVCITLYLKKPQQSYRGIFVAVFSFYLYYIIFAVIPVVGPQYYIPCDTQTVPPHFFGQLMRHIIVNLEQPTGAFPSSHVGLAIILSYIAYKHLKRIFVITLPFVIGICFATIYIKAHYLLDVVAGIVTAPLFILISNKTYNWLLSLSFFNRRQDMPVKTE